MAPHLFHSILAVDVNQIDREAHAKGMHGFTGNDPETFSRIEAVAPQQAFAALGAAVGHFHPFGKHRLAGEIRYLQPDSGLSPAAAGELSKNAAHKVYFVRFDRSTSIKNRSHGIVGRQRDRASIGPGCSNQSGIRAVG